MNDGTIGPGTRLFVLLQYLLPHHLLSRLTGRLASCRWPWLKDRLIDTFVRAFDVDLTEAEHQDGHRYEHFNAFFTRALREGVRPVDASPGVLVSPADGLISQAGRLDGQQLLQAKGHHFSAAALLADAAEAERFADGRFMTIYLSPRDYHRVHMACSGTLRYMRHVPGRLFSVNAGTTALVDRLFARNERLVCGFDTSNGPMVMVLVGAMIVAGIETVWAGSVVPPGKGVSTWHYDPQVQAPTLAAGEEMGRFQLGSTVILLFPAGAVDWRLMHPAGQGLRMGQAIGDWTGKGNA